MKRKELSLVIPCYNEEKNIPLLIKKIRPLVTNSNLELVLVENGSKDSSLITMKEYAKRYSWIKIVSIKINIGYGNGVFQGLKKAQGEFIGWTHADLQTDPADALKALELIKNQRQSKSIYVKGNRYGRSVFDSFFTLGMSIFETMIMGKFMYDINAQPNIFHRSFLNSIKNPPKDFSFDLYVYYLAKKNKLKIIRFPVYFGKRLHGHSHWNFGISSKIKFIKRTLKFSLELRRSMKK
jgi:glycosyltransferase involved in cell wall biosynthesis